MSEWIIKAWITLRIFFLGRGTLSESHRLACDLVDAFKIERR